MVTTTPTTTGAAGSAAARLGVTTYEQKKAATQGAGRGADSMGKQDFLTLFTAQLRNQNPLDPVKNEAFVAQLAQFSQLEALTNMQSALDGFVGSMSAQRMLGGAALIGKRVPVSGGAGQLGEQGGIDASLTLASAASGLTLQVAGADGQVVRTLVSGARDPGTLDFSWDGMTDAGSRAPAGAYTLRATATMNGSTQAVDVRTLATVRSVLTDPATNDVKLQMDGGATVPLSAVERFSQ